MEDDTILLEFKAGKMALVGTRLQADARKGTVRLVRAVDTLLHLQWYLRTDDAVTSDPEDDVIIFPDEANFEKISQSNSRVYILKFLQESDRNVFFWLQEPDAQQDEALVNAVNQIINTPAGMDEDSGEEEDEEGEDVSAAAASALAAAASTSGATAALSQDPRALAQLLSLGLQSAMQQQQPGGGDLATSTANSLLAQLAARQQWAQAVKGPSLADVLKPETLAPLLADPDMLPRLAEHLPEGQQDADSLVKLAHSSQFHQQLGAFSSALQTGQLDLLQFGLKAKGFSTADFLEAVQEMVEREGKQEGEGSGQEKKSEQ